MAANTYYYKDCTINIVSKRYDEVDFNSYDKVNEIEKIDLDDPDFCKLIEISVNGNGTEKNALIIASYHTPIDSFVAPHKNGLFLMLNEILCVFDPETLEIIDQSEIDPFGTMFEIHQYKDDYILYGECEIYRISDDLKVKWIFGARDIFVRCDTDAPAFEMKEDRIGLYDYQENYYEINYDGKLITERINENC